MGIHDLFGQEMFPVQLEDDVRDLQTKVGDEHPAVSGIMSAIIRQGNTPDTGKLILQQIE